jgi:hydrogenase maturation factor HypF (carbamoyltransferase family)
MLPYTPLHHLLVTDAGAPLVRTIAYGQVAIAAACEACA